MRQIVLDTETTGLEPSQGHRIIEIGCVELENRRITRKQYHQYLNPEREIDEGAVEVHGLTSEFLADKPLFEDIVEDFLTFIEGAELIIHNAPFDVGFINHELRRLGTQCGALEDHCTILDSLALARHQHPGQKNSLDALCKRYSIDNSQRELHGALLDAEILADVYLAMTGGQVRLALGRQGEQHVADETASQSRLRQDRPALRVISASADEADAHRQRLQAIDTASGGQCLWLRLEDPG